MRRILILCGLALLLGSGPSDAQVSPGPLSNAHASLEGNHNCQQCHGLKRGSKVGENCLQCHQGIAWSIEAGRGLHARGTSTACEKCHPEHAGRDFDLVEWPDGNQDVFRHSRTGWRLEGAHAKQKCVACHRKDRQTGPAATREPAGRIHDGDGWLGLETGCAHCHNDPHATRLGTDCESCHGGDAWTPVRNFDHARTRFPLDGKHKNVECAKCHEGAASGAVVAADGSVRPVLYPIPHQDCQPCHSDPHAGRFAGSCSACHSTRGFREASGKSFNHRLTRFPLRGAHAKVRCEDCHDTQKAWGKRPAHDRCDQCHTDPHGAQLASSKRDCSDCHNEKDWHESGFDLKRHASTAFPLVGAHARVKCEGCHRAEEGMSPDPAWGKAAVEMRPASASCTDCHAPAHGKEIDASRTCSECHNVEKWTPSLFDLPRHAASGWPLEMAHAETKCRACHLAEPDTTNPGASTASSGPARILFASVGKACADCHLDPHAARYGKGEGWSPDNRCRECHTLRRFVPSTIEPGNHTRWGFLLDGAHRAVPCTACHAELDGPPSASSLVGATGRKLGFAGSPRTCRDCHNQETLRSAEESR